MSRAYLLIFLLILAQGTLRAQNKQLLYGLWEVPQSSLLNPAVVGDQQKHFGIPLFSHIHINGGSSGVTVYDIFGGSSGTINDRIRARIFDMRETDFFTLTQQWEFLNFGWRSKNDSYFSGGVYQELDFIFYFPRDLAILAWEGNRDYLEYPFDLGQIAGRADLLTVYHFGIQRQVGRKLKVGGRMKLYSSMLSAHSVNNRGTFTTRLAEGSSNIYEHRIENARVRLHTSGIASLEDTGGGAVSEMLGRAFFGGSLGLGIDLGATYALDDRWSASASLLDIGLIFHHRDPETYEARGDYNLDGIELLFPPLTDDQTAIPYYDNLEDEIEEAIPVDTLNTAYSQWRPLKLNASIDYGFGGRAGGSGVCDCRNMNAGVRWTQQLGLQLYGIIRPGGPQLAATMYYYRRFWRFLAAKATYTIDPFGFTNLGLGVVVDSGRFNFYIAGDNILHYANLARANSVSLQLGVNLIIDQR